MNNFLDPKPEPHDEQHQNNIFIKKKLDKRDTALVVGHKSLRVSEILLDQHPAEFVLYD